MRKRKKATERGRERDPGAVRKKKGEERSVSGSEEGQAGKRRGDCKS